MLYEGSVDKIRMRMKRKKKKEKKREQPRSILRFPFLDNSTIHTIIRPPCPSLNDDFAGEIFHFVVNVTSKG